jgi:hypothetical protein
MTNGGSNNPAGTGGTPNKPNGTDGTPSNTTEVLTKFKEYVTAGLGVLIIILTLILLWSPLSKSPADTTSGQGIFAILGGWGGIIIGYYFGRLPSEKAADKASGDADNARKDTAIANNKKILAITSCNNILDNNEKSLKALRSKLEVQRLAQTIQGVSQADLKSTLDEIDNYLNDISTSRQKIQNMLV